MKLPSLNKLEKLYKTGDIKKVAKWLPHLRHSDSSFAKFLMNSNILRMKDHVNEPVITFGADPEFILHEKGKKGNIVLFSSQFTSDYFGVAEAEIGADYGLLEFRPAPCEDPKGLVSSIEDLHKRFGEEYPDFEILEKEAIEYDHKKARILELLQEEKEINYGMNRGKDVGIWATAVTGNEIVIGQETGTSMSAYDKPTFNQFNDELFTAGGHIHIGGSYIMMLSLNQLKCLVRKLDDRILPICKKVETKAGELRRTVYGAPGEFRLKSYGIEYRSPSNAIFWNKNLKLLLKVLNEITDIVKTMAIN